MSKVFSMGAGWQARISLLLLLVAIACARPPVLKLESQNFEAYTQAATGQTTGVWFILFTSSHEPSLQHLSRSWEDYGASQLAEPQQVIHGVVDVADEPDLADRFHISSLPTFLLFRNRKVPSSSAPFACMQVCSAYCHCPGCAQ